VVITCVPNRHARVQQEALAYYALRDYDRAQIIFESIRNRDPYRLQHLETYSNILYVKEKSAELSHLAHTVVKIEKYCPESCCVVGNYYSLKAQHERAIMYFQRALKLNPKYLSGKTLQVRCIGIGFIIERIVLRSLDTHGS
jgi:anaphase-promoting complex subunit 8